MIAVRIAALDAANGSAHPYDSCDADFQRFPHSQIGDGRAKAHGLDGLAALHNDDLLILDELSQVDPKESGETTYLLANAQGNARVSRTGIVCLASRWRLLFLSADEEYPFGACAVQIGGAA